MLEKVIYTIFLKIGSSPLDDCTYGWLEGVEDNGNSLVKMGRERGKEVTCIFGMPVCVSIITTQEVATGDAKTLCPMHTASASQYLTNCLKDQQCSQEDEIVEDSEYKTFFLIRINYIISKKFIQLTCCLIFSNTFVKPTSGCSGYSI